MCQKDFHESDMLLAVSGAVGAAVGGGAQGRAYDCAMAAAVGERRAQAGLQTDDDRQLRGRVVWEREAVCGRGRRASRGDQGKSPVVV